MNLLQETRRLYLGRPWTVTLDVISSESKVPRRSVMRIVTDIEPHDPRVSAVQAVYDFLSSQSSKAA